DLWHDSAGSDAAVLRGNATEGPSISPMGNRGLLKRIKTTEDGAASMSSFALKETILAGLLAVAPIVSAMAQQAATPPDFSSNLAGWVGLNGGGPFYEPVPGVPGRLSPVVSDPAHPFTPNGVDKQPTFRIADLSNPNLKP